MQGLPYGRPFLHWYPQQNELTSASGAKRNGVRIPRPKIDKRLAKQGICQAQGEGIFAAGEILAGGATSGLHNICRPLFYKYNGNYRKAPLCKGSCRKATEGLLFAKGGGARRLYAKQKRRHSEEGKSARRRISQAATPPALHTLVPRFFAQASPVLRMTDGCLGGTKKRLPL